MTDSAVEKPEPSAGEESKTHSDDGVDLTLIRWMLSLSPAERLLTLQNTIRSFERLADVVNEP